MSEWAYVLAVSLAFAIGYVGAHFTGTCETCLERERLSRAAKPEPGPVTGNATCGACFERYPGRVDRFGQHVCSRIAELRG